MTDQLLDIVITCSIAVGIAMLHALGKKLKLRGTRSWRLIMHGLGLLLLGNLIGLAYSFHVLDWAGPVASPQIGSMLSNYVCFFGGAVLIVIGLVGQVSTAGYQDRIRRLEKMLARTSAEARTTKEFAHHVIQSSLSGVMTLIAVRDEGGKTVDLEVRNANREAEQILGRAAASLVEKRLLEQLPCIRADGLFDKAISVLDTGMPLQTEHSREERSVRRWYRIGAVRLSNESLIVNFADITKQKQSEDQLRHAAQHDALTGLPNRALFTQRLRDAIGKLQRSAGYAFAVLFLDFDRFKIINDSLGHEAGDQLLINIAERLRTNLRIFDTAARVGDGHLPARLGGDEFVVLLEGIKSEESAVAVADRLQRELSAPHQIAGQEVISTASIGIVFSDRRYKTPDEVLRDADTAMYQAKTTGKARHVVFDEHMHQAAVQRLELERALRDAVDERTFLVEYEPIVALDSGRITGFEALIRWLHPKRGLVAPAEFLALAAELSLIVPIGEWVLREACLAHQRWRTSVPEAGALTIAVNLARQQLLMPDLIATIRRILEETGTPPESLQVEVTESMVIDDASAVGPVLRELKTLGVRIVMDDFGAGRSSLSCLNQYPIDVLKIDRSFVAGVERRRRDAAIVHAVVSVAHNLEMKVVAEGVETAAQLALLQALDCNYAQGQLFSPPVAAAAVEQMLREGRRFHAAASLAA